MKRKILLWIILILPYIGLYSTWKYYGCELKKVESASFIIISKSEMSLSLYNYKGVLLKQYPVSIGKNAGNKSIVGDMKTPEGVFTISDIQNSSNWSHDFGDGKGVIEGAYGPYFIRLLTPGHSGIGIHGTHDNSSLNTRSTEGCVRLMNENILELVELINYGTVVVITPSIEDLKDSFKRQP